MLIAGLVMIGFGISLLPIMLTSKSDLAQIKGTLRGAHIYITTAPGRYGNGGKKSELIFYLNGHLQKYALVEHIGGAYRNEEYEKILKGLQRADSISVWVRKREVDDYQPVVFQIDSDNKTLLDFKTVRRDKSPMTVFLLLTGLGSLFVYLWLVRRSGNKSKNA